MIYYGAFDAANNFKVMLNIDKVNEVALCGIK